MTPEERRRVDELFDKLETLERNPRDEDAEHAIRDGLARAPHALYPLVQTVLVQDEALRAADARISELQAELGYDAPQRSGGFLDNMRDALFGRGEPQRRGSVPSVGREPMGAPNGFGQRQPWSQQPMQQEQQQPQGRGGSFLGTAAATAAGAIGGYMLMNSLGGLFGGGQAQAAQGRPGEQSQWGGNDAASGSLAQDAGLNDMRGGSERQGWFDSSNDGGGGDFGGGDGGGGGGE